MLNTCFLFLKILPPVQHKPESECMAIINCDNNIECYCLDLLLNKKRAKRVSDHNALFFILRKKKLLLKIKNDTFKII